MERELPALVLVPIRIVVPAAVVAAAPCAQTSRVAEIIAEREAKARTLQPEDTTGTERAMVAFKERKIMERFTAGIGGLRSKLGGLATNGGFAFGPEYLRSDLADGQVRFRSAAQVSLRGFQKYDIELGLVRLAGGRASLDFYGVHHNYSSIQHYGSGPDSEKTGRSNYRLEDTAFDASFRAVYFVTSARSAQQGMCSTTSVRDVNRALSRPMKSLGSAADLRSWIESAKREGQTPWEYLGKQYQWAMVLRGAGTPLLPTAPSVPQTRSGSKIAVAPSAAPRLRPAG